MALTCCSPTPFRTRARKHWGLSVLTVKTLSSLYIHIQTSDWSHQNSAKNKQNISQTYKLTTWARMWGQKKKKKVAIYSLMSSMIQLAISRCRGWEEAWKSPHWQGFWDHQRGAGKVFLKGPGDVTDISHRVKFPSPYLSFARLILWGCFSESSFGCQVWNATQICSNKFCVEWG